MLTIVGLRYLYEMQIFDACLHAWIEFEERGSELHASVRQQPILPHRFFV